MSETNEENIAYINFTDEVTVNPYIILFFYLYPVLVGVGLRGFGLRLWGQGLTILTLSHSVLFDPILFMVAWKDRS